MDRTDTIPSPQLDRREASGAWWSLVLLLVLGLAARFALLGISFGSIDVLIWERLASTIHEHGLYETYRQNVQMNHPPLAGMWAALLIDIAQSTGIGFVLLLKLPVAIADCLSCWILYLVWRARGGAIVGLQAAAFYAWNIDAIIISGHHGNSDPVYSMLALLALWLVEIRRWPMLAGLALGAAINVKLIPALLLAPMLILHRSPRELGRIIIGLAVMAIPCVYVWIDLGWRFRQRVIQYHSAATGWGLLPLIDQLSNHPLLKGYFDTVAERYRRSGAMLVMALAVLAMLRRRRRGQQDRFAATGAAAALYAAVTPALAPHHTIFVGVLIFAADYRAGAIWGLLSGAWVLVYHLFFWDGTLPIRQMAEPYLPAPTNLVALVPWVWVAWYAWRMNLRAPPAVR